MCNQFNPWFWFVSIGFSLMVRRQRSIGHFPQISCILTNTGNLEFWVCVDAVMFESCGLRTLCLYRFLTSFCVFVGLRYRHIVRVFACIFSVSIPFPFFLIICARFCLYIQCVLDWETLFVNLISYVVPISIGLKPISWAS